MTLFVFLTWVQCFRYFFHFVLFSFVLEVFVFSFVCLEFGVLSFVWFLSAAVKSTFSGQQQETIF